MELLELLKTKRTYRRFQQKEISQEIINEMLLAARYASSARNAQPLSYVVVKNPDTVREIFKLTKWAGYLPPEQGQPKSGEEPVLFIGIIQNTDINLNCDTDAGLAISNMTLAAWNNGIGSCIIGACDKPRISEIMKLNENQKLHSVVAFGYPSHKSLIEDVNDDNDIRYYINDEGNYVVPKRKLSDTVKFIN